MSRDRHRLSPKSILESVLRPFPPFYRVGSRLYNKLNGGFRSASPGLPDGIRRAFQLANELHDGKEIGDYYEFGVFRGHSLLAAQQACDSLGISGTRFFGFDSFQGLPVIEGVDKTYNKFFEGQFACSKTAVIKFLTARGFDWSRADLIEGEFSRSLTTELVSEYSCKSVAVALLDCDLYSSTRDALEWLRPLMANQSIIMFDDWYSYNNDPELGQQRSFSQFLASNPAIEVQPLWEFAEDGMAFVVHRV